MTTPDDNSQKPEDKRKKLGTRGEQLVAQHLTSRGWHVLAVNYRCRQGEIDMIAHEPTSTGNTLVFIEVKTRHGQAHGTPSEAVDARKQRKLYNLAQAYLGTIAVGGEEPACRFDVAEVFIDTHDMARIELRRAFFMEE